MPPLLSHPSHVSKGYQGLIAAQLFSHACRTTDNASEPLSAKLRDFLYLLQKMYRDVANLPGAVGATILLTVIAIGVTAIGNEVQFRSKYNELENLLKASNWQEADAETDRIVEQLSQQTFEKNKGNDFVKNPLGRTEHDEDTSYGVENSMIFYVPCKDLKEIDRLWVKYSNGKHGFSVQRSDRLNRLPSLADDMFKHDEFLSESSYSSADRHLSECGVGNS
jgi:hypothetical protein